MKRLVFLSYKREDINEVEFLHKVLRANGIRVWSDLEFLPPGSDVEREIRRAIQEECKAFLMYVTPSSLSSDFIWRVEVSTAYEKSRRENGNFLLIPIFRSEDLIEPFRKKSIDVLGTDLSNRNGFVLHGKLESNTLNELARRLLEHIIKKAEYTPIQMFTYPPVPTTPPGHLVLDWADFFAETEVGPTLSTWREILTPALKNVRSALLRKDRPQYEVWLPTRIHLSAALAYGWIFREIKGFRLVASDRLKQENPEDKTDPALFSKLKFELIPGTETEMSDNIFLGISIAKDVRPTLDRIIQQGYQYKVGIVGNIENMGRRSILNTTHARLLAEQTVAQLLKIKYEYRTHTTDLLISSSVQYAAYLGWYLNACGDFTYWQYRNRKGDAVPSCNLEALWDGDT